MMLKTIDVIDDRKLTLEVLEGLLGFVGFKTRIDKSDKTLWIEKKKYISTLVKFHPRKSYINLFCAIRARDDIDELAFARAVNKLNSRSSYCNFDYHFSKRHGHMFGASSKLQTADGLVIQQLLYLTENFCIEFINSCFSKEAKTLLHYKRGRLYMECP